MKMADRARFLNSFLELSSYPILTDKCKVSALEAKLKAEGAYEVYRRRQDAAYLSDFDRVVRETRRLEGQQEPKPLGPSKRPAGPKATRSESGNGPTAQCIQKFFQDHADSSAVRQCV